MVTELGKLHIKRYLSGVFGDIGRSIAFGIGSAEPTLEDTQLQFEVYRVPVDILAYDFDADKLIFKGTVPDEFAAKITEVGLYSREDSVAGTSGSRTIASFDSASEAWYRGSDPAEFTTDEPLVGSDSVILTTPSGQSSTVLLQNISLNLLDYSASDQFVFAFHSGSGSPSIEYRFLTDNENYYSFSIAGNTTSTGINMISRDKGSASVTGAPSWSDISAISVIVTSGSSQSVVKLEAIRLDDTDTVDEGYILVSRIVLPSPFVKEAGSTQDVEFPLEVNLG